MTQLSGSTVTSETMEYVETILSARGCNTGYFLHFINDRQTLLRENIEQHGFYLSQLLIPSTSVSIY